MRLVFLSEQIQEASRVAGINGVTKLGEVMKQYNGLSQERVRKVWHGDVNAKIGDYIDVTQCLDFSMDLPTIDE